MTGHSFAALIAMMMKSSSFESPKLYLLTLNSKNSIAGLLTPACHDMMKSANLLHKFGLGDSDMNRTVKAMFERGL